MKKKEIINMVSPWTREIEKIDKNHPLVFPESIEISRDVIKYCVLNNISRRKQKKLINLKQEEEFNKLSLEDIENRLKHPGSSLEIIAIDHNNVLEILKRNKDFISKDNLVEIITDLMNGTKYIAQYGFDLVLVDNKNYELIELEDFNFKFDSEADLRKVINILQILDSEFYQFEKLDKFYKGIFILRDSFFDDLKREKCIKRDEATYLYLEPKFFTEMDRLPENYPDMTNEILNELGFN